MLSLFVYRTVTLRIIMKSCVTVVEIVIILKSNQYRKSKKVPIPISRLFKNTGRYEFFSNKFCQ